MPLAPGTRLGPYEILSQLGEGGMGDVYRARDSRLNRTVAIKVSKEEFSKHFEREAHAVAALNHPHICTLHDIGPNYLVMEHIDGKPLRGPLSIDKAIEYARQILEALDAAHRRGIVHRDLKPANILLTRGGIKLLDFGLAQNIASKSFAAAVAEASTMDSTIPQDATLSGTLQYMAPEQLQGGDIDGRADIFAFGCVFYELLTGKAAFAGSTMASVIAAVIEREVPMVDAVAPEPVALLLRRCLEKDPEERWQSARDIKAALDCISVPSSGQGLAEAASSTRRWMPWIGGVSVAVAAAAIAFGFVFSRPAPPVNVARFSLLPPDKTAFTTLLNGTMPPAISPDGTRVAFSARTENGAVQIWVRRLDSIAAQALPGTEGGIFPFWSPDSQSIGFFAENKLKRIEAAGGAVLTLTPVTTSPRGASWSSQGFIVYSPNSVAPLRRIPAYGGTSSPATAYGAGESTHRFPWFLPDGKHFLYSAGAIGVDHNTIRVGSLDTPATGSDKAIGEADSSALYAAGYLLFLRGNRLMAQPFDLGSLSTKGEAIPLAEQVQRLPTAMRGTFDVSGSGLLIYTADSGPSTRLGWFDRTGKNLSTIGEPADLDRLSLSPDRKYATAAVTDSTTGNSDIWIYDAEKGQRSQFTFDPSAELDSTFAPDGSAVVFVSNRKGHFDLFRKSTSGNGGEELLLADQTEKLPTSFTPDGKFMTYYSFDPKIGNDLWILPDPLGPVGASKPYRFLSTPARELNGQFAPGPSWGGKWIAYQSDESGRSEIYVLPFPGAGMKHQVSTGGGTMPRWRPDGKEIFYIAPDQHLMAAPVSFAGGNAQIGEAHSLFGPLPVSQFYEYDISADGQRILTLVQPNQPSLVAFTVVQNWTSALHR